MATWVLNGAHVLVLERVKYSTGQSLGAAECRALRRRGGRESESRRLGLPIFFGRQQLAGRVEATFNAEYNGNGYNRSRQLRGAYTTTEKIAGGLQQKKDAGKRRLILLRHAKSSWADRSLKGNCELHLIASVFSSSFT